MALQTRNVFVDTQAFVKAGLDFQSKEIQAFTDACEKGDFSHLMTTVSTREIQDKIRDAIKEALERVKGFRRKAKLLEGSTDQVIAGLFAHYDPDQVQARAQEVFQAFLDDSNTTVIDLKKVDADEVFRRYFDQEAPFQDGKKKDEFPDAFSLLALESHLTDQEECYVVSEDGDLKAFCQTSKRFILVEDLGKLLDIYNSHDAERSELVKNYLSDHKVDIMAAITAQVDSAEFYNSSSWEDAEVSSHTVRQVNDFEPDIIHIDDEICSVSFEAIVRYKVEVVGPDFINGIYDREGGRMMTFGTTSRTEEDEIEVKVEIELQFEINQGKFEVAGMDVDVVGLSSGVEVSVDEEEFMDPRM